MDTTYVLVITTDASLDEVEGWAFGVMSRNTPPGNVTTWSVSTKEDAE